MKVGKEEAMGMLAAVEAWGKRDHQAEWNNWMSWMNNIAKDVGSIQGVTASIKETKELSNHSPVLSIRWSTDTIGITGADVEHTLLNTEPRITLSGMGERRFGHPSPGNETGVSITAYMMCPGDDKIVGERLRDILSKSAGTKLAKDTRAPSSDISGQWDVQIEFAAGRSTHNLYLLQNDSDITGTHQGDFLARDLLGSMHGNEVKMTSSIGEQHGAVLNYTFTGTVDSGTMEGDLNLSEYRAAKWRATRHQSDFGGPGRA
jgi:L-seryl-tRNA(Ser) seleniumtransferase